MVLQGRLHIVLVLVRGPLRFVRAYVLSGDGRLLQLAVLRALDSLGKVLRVCRVKHRLEDLNWLILHILLSAVDHVSVVALPLLVNQVIVAVRSRILDIAERAARISLSLHVAEIDLAMVNAGIRLTLHNSLHHENVLHNKSIMTSQHNNSI